MRRAWTDDELADLARACFKEAEQREEPERTEEDRRSILQALVDDRTVRQKHRAAIRIIRRILDQPAGTQSALRARVPKPANTRHWAIWFMMNALLEISAVDP